MTYFQLQSYSQIFNEVCKVKFGRTYEFEHLERDFRHLAQGKRWLAAKDVSKLFDPNRTPFLRYWPRPNDTELDQILRKERVWVGPVPAQPLTLVKELLDIFHSTGILSILLRFVHPDRFGIISSPVLNLIQISRANTADLYVAYCDELSAWQSKFRMRSVAETEMALWAFYQYTEGGAKARDAANALKVFEGDVWIQRRRLGHVLDPFLKRYGPLDLADLLCHKDPNLAGKIVGEEYEKRLRSVAAKHYPKMKFDDGWALRLIELLKQNHLIDEKDGPELRYVWEVRNKAVHATESPAVEEVERMLDSVRRICAPWRSKGDD